MWQIYVPHTHRWLDDGDVLRHNRDVAREFDREEHAAEKAKGMCDEMEIVGYAVVVSSDAETYTTERGTVIAVA